MRHSVTVCPWAQLLALPVVGFIPVSHRVEVCEFSLRVDAGNPLMALSMLTKQERDFHV